MDMEKLTKQQIVLVTLLVSFVTSIATGIVTVALMDQAPAGVTQTINRVVERTIEKVVTAPADNNNSAAVVTRETIVVKEDDKIVESVDKNKNSVVRIYTNNRNEESQQIFVGLGTIVSADGLIATGEVFADRYGKYLVTLDEKKFYEVKILPRVENNSIYFLKIVPDRGETISLTPVVFGNSDLVKLGQTVIGWGGQNHSAVSTGIISSLGVNENNDKNASSTAQNIVALSVNMGSVDNVSGGPLLNLNGEAIGIKVSDGILATHDFLPANILKREIYATTK